MHQVIKQLLQEAAYAQDFEDNMPVLNPKFRDWSDSDIEDYCQNCFDSYPDGSDFYREVEHESCQRWALRAYMMRHAQHRAH